MILVGIAVGAAIGAPARYLLDGFVQRRWAGAFPLGTFVVNVSGSLLLGVLGGLVLYHGLSRLPAAAVGTGFAGSYTTFSTWAYETMALAEERAVLEAALNAVGSAVAGLLAAAVGLAVGAAL